MVLEEERVRRVIDLISEYGLDAEIIWHKEKPIFSLKDAEEILGLAPRNVLKCLLLKSRKGKVVAVMATGDVRLDIKKLERLSEAKKLSFVSSQELEDRFGVEPGGIDPFTLLQVADMVVAERSLLEREFVVGSAGSKYCGLKIKPRDFIVALNVSVHELAAS